MKTNLSNSAVKSEYTINVLKENAQHKLFRVPVQMYCSQAWVALEKKKMTKVPSEYF